MQLTRTKLGDEVVRIVRLHHLQQLHNVGMANHLQQLRLTTKILVHIWILLGFLLVNDLDSNLQVVIVLLAGTRSRVSR